MLSLIMAAAVGGAMAPTAITCPAGTTAKRRKTAEASEAWCETSAGVRHGPRHAFYQDGAKWFVGEYANGKRSGQWRFWYPSGNLRSQGTYRADKRHGRSEQLPVGEACSQGDALP